MLSLKYLTIEKIFNEELSIDNIPEDIKNDYNEIKEYLPYCGNVHEFLRFLEDREKYGDEYTGEYRNIKYKLRRPHKVSWCGYINLEKDTFNEKQYYDLEQFSQWGFTAQWGFDCAHSGDYNPSQLFNLMGLYKVTGDKKILDILLNKEISPIYTNGDTYKDFDYVINIIKTIIDEMYKVRDDFN